MRCQIINKTNGLVCKKNSSFILNNKRCCKFHYNYYMQKYAIIIQKYYRAYKNKKIINNIFLKLPDDLQRKIVFHMREEFHYNKYKKCIENIIYNRLKISRTELTKHFSYNFGDNRLLKYLIKQENKISILNNVYLLKKYMKLFNFTYKTGDYDFIKHIIYTKLQEFESEISNHAQNNIFENVWGLYISIRNLNT